MSIIKELYDGNICPADKRFDNQEYGQAAQLYEEAYKRLYKKLPKKQYRIIDKMAGYHQTMEYEYGREMFAEGFNMGFRFAAEGVKEK